MNNQKDNNQPNLETVEDIKESEKLICDKNAKIYASFSEILEEVNDERDSK